MKIANPVNELQEKWNELCSNGGGQSGGPPRGKVQELLYWGSQNLNDLAHEEISNQLEELSDRDPWKICFAVGLGWGHLAKIDIDFTDAAVRALETLDPEGIAVACKFPLERGPKPIEQSLIGGYQMFQHVKLPKELPDTLALYRKAQERWLRPLLDPTIEKPRYIGGWNATAMFMVGLFSNRKLWSHLKNSEVLLPHGGPISNGLRLLHAGHVVSAPPIGYDNEDEKTVYGAIVESNGVMKELVAGKLDLNLIDIHTGIYMLGTRTPESKKWL